MRSLLLSLLLASVDARSIARQQPRLQRLRGGSSVSGNRQQLPAVTAVPQAHSRTRLVAAAAPKSSGTSDWSGDYTAIALLMVLYTLQGIPIGLGTVVPFLLAEKGVSSMEQAVFTMVQYPFAMKLLWAPLVDSIYSRWVGRRKSWIIPVQPAIGALMLYASSRVNTLLGDVPDVRALTGYFLAFYFLAATQDIAVDGLALTALSERNKELGATCNAVGQTLGFFLAYVGFLALNSYGLASFGGFMAFWGWVFIGSTLAVLAVRGKDEHGEPSAPSSGGGSGGGDAATGAYGESAADLWARLMHTYREMWMVLQLPAVRSLALVLLTVKAPLAAFDTLVPLELVKVGVPKERLAAMNMVLLPVSMTTQAYVSRFFSGVSGTGEKRVGPLRFLLLGYKMRLLYGALCLVLVGAIAQTARTAARLLPPLYGAGLLAACWGAAASSAMFVAQMAFYNRVSDPKIGGTYMTMLNTLSNLGGQWPGTVVLATKGMFESLGIASGFYAVGVCSLALGVAWLWLMQSRVEDLQRRPRDDWLATAQEPDAEAGQGGRRKAKRR